MSFQVASYETNMADVGHFNKLEFTLTMFRNFKINEYFNFMTYVKDNNSVMSCQITLIQMNDCESCDTDHFHHYTSLGIYYGF